MWRPSARPPVLKDEVARWWRVSSAARVSSPLVCVCLLFVHVDSNMQGCMLTTPYPRSLSRCQRPTCSPPTSVAHQPTNLHHNLSPRQHMQMAGYGAAQRKAVGKVLCVAGSSLSSLPWASDCGPKSALHTPMVSVLCLQDFLVVWLI